MNKLQQFFEQFTAANLKETVAATFKRFYVQFACVTVTAVIAYCLLASLDISNEVSMYLGILAGVLMCGSLMDFTLVLFGENPKHKNTFIFSRIVLWVALMVCYILLVDSKIKDTNSSFAIACACVVGSFALMIPFAGFVGLKDNNDMPAYNLMIKLIIYQVLLGIVQMVLFSGGELLILAISTLFECQASENVSLGLGITLMWFIICSFYFFVPRGENLQDSSTDNFRILSKLIQYVFLPLLIVYVIVILIYALRVLIAWELPKGMVSYLVSGVMFTYIFCYVCLYPKLQNIGSKLYRLMHTYIPISLFPLLVLMTVGVIRRVSDYGITPERLYLITLLVWFYGVNIVILVRKTPRIRWIFVSFALLLLLSSAHPLNYTKIGQMVNVAEYEQLLEEYHLTELQEPEEAKKVYDNLPDSVRTNIDEKQRYLKRRYGYEGRVWKDKQTYPLNETNL